MALGAWRRAWVALPLARQLFLALFTSVVLTSSVYFVYDVWAANRRIVGMERSTMEAVFPILQRIVEDAMVRKSAGEMRRLFDAGPRGGVHGQMFLLDERKRAVDIGDLARGRPPRRFEPRSSGRTDLVLDFPMRARAECARCHKRPESSVLGYVRLTSPHDEKARTIAAHVRDQLLVVAVMTLILGAWAVFVVRVVIQRPVGRIVEAMRELQQGRLEARVKDPPTGELGVIADGFHTMVEELARDRRRIVELHRRQVAHMERLVSVGELAAHLAHEVRNPLTGIGSALQLLQRDFPPEHPRHDLVAKVLSQLQRMDQTMANFLRYARLPEAVVRPFDLREVLQRVFLLIEPRLKAQSVELRKDIAGDLPELLGDPGQIEQVLLNLCLNAAQAMPSGGTLAVGARAEDASVRLEVADTGHGIPPEQLEQVFLPYFTTRENGSGLGLPISKQIVAAHAGELWLESVPSRGTSAHLRLPLPAAEAALPER